MRKVVGPGSPPVQAAQIACQLHGVHTQMLLGPSESLILADDSADVRLLAADLLNEAEHGPDSSSLLVTDSEPLVEAVQEAVAAQLADLPEPRRGYAGTALGENGGAVLAADLETACEIANAYAPEHMQIVARDEERLLERAPARRRDPARPVHARSARQLHARCARRAAHRWICARDSGITAAPSSRARRSQGRARRPRRLAPAILALADHEGFPAHAAAVRMRLTAPHPPHPE